MDLFITGGTGFFGKALLRKFLEDFQCGKKTPTSISVLSRSPSKFLNQNIEFADIPWLRLIQGDVSDLASLPHQDHYTHIIHAATESTNGLLLSPLARYEQIVHGTENMLKFATSVGAKRFLLTSSGAVYGPQPSDISSIPESYNGHPNPLSVSNAYGVGKRAAEHLCALYSNAYGFDVVIGRCFAFVGRDLPLDVHFAIGNFIGKAIQGKDIVVKGDGSPIRTYMDQRDLAVWLMRLLVSGKNNNAYNVGSDQAITIANLAKLVKEVVAPQVNILIEKQESSGSNRNLYVPSIEKAKQELGLGLYHPLALAIHDAASSIANAKVNL
jgi:UDP-glucuronate decarboxylase